MPRMERSVDLPAPEGPMTEMNSPGWTSTVIRRSTNMRPAGVSKTFSRLRIAMSGPVIGAGSAAANRDCVDEENKPMESSEGSGDGRPIASRLEKGSRGDGGGQQTGRAFSDC